MYQISHSILCSFDELCIYDTSKTCKQTLMCNTSPRLSAPNTHENEYITVQMREQAFIGKQLMHSFKKYQVPSSTTDTFTFSKSVSYLAHLCVMVKT